jgi:ribonucleoside-diphosphate reductase beta chain
MSLISNRSYYKPFEYPWAFEAHDKQLTMHWHPKEVSLREDTMDWVKLTPEEKNLLTQIFRFFTQADVDVADGYTDKFIPIFGGHPEVKMMMMTFAAMEAIHIQAYSMLLDTIGMPETEYNAFQQFKEMKDKHDYLGTVNIGTQLVWDKDHTVESYCAKDIARALAVYSAFTEGLQLFSSFAILLNFTRFGKMKGMGKIVQWSIRDETHHVESMIHLFRVFISENKEIWTDEFKKELYDVARKMVELEDNFIDLAFEQGGIQGLTKDEVKEYVRYIADRRLLQLGLKTNYGVKKNPLPWIEEMLNVPEHTNFFENRATNYGKAATTGEWPWEK